MESTKKESLFLYLYDSYVNDLYAYGKALGVSHEDLQDIIHDVFLKVSSINSIYPLVSDSRTL